VIVILPGLGSAEKANTDNRFPIKVLHISSHSIPIALRMTRSCPAVAHVPFPEELLELAGHVLAAVV